MGTNKADGSLLIMKAGMSVFIAAIVGVVAGISIAEQSSR